MSAPIYFLSDGISSRPIIGDAVHIGRGTECDIQLNDLMISRKHCVLIKRGESLMVQDLNSSNGTFVNGEQVARAILRVGDFVILGGTGFVVENTAYGCVWERLHAFSRAQSFVKKQFQKLVGPTPSFGAVES